MPDAHYFFLATSTATTAKASILARPRFWIGLLIIATLFFLLSRCNNNTAHNAADVAKSATQAAANAGKAAADAPTAVAKSAGEATTATADAAKAPAQPASDTTKAAGATLAGAIKSIELPDGARIDAPAGGFIASVAEYLKGSGAAGRSFTFDELHFATGAAPIEAQSQAQLSKLGAVLKAYPSAKVELDGYTDNVGDPAANRKLSLARAGAAKQALVAAGVPAARVAASGQGADRPVASNDTEDGRAKNRRVELVIAKR